MTILARDKKQLTYIYSSFSHLGKQVLGYVEGIDKKVEVIDIAKQNLGDTIWVEIAENLGLPISNLITTENDYVSSIGNTNDFNTDDWLKIINKNPKLLQKPIAIKGEEAMLITHRSDILKFFGVDSAGLEKGLNGEPPTISSTTKDENFI
ncbi:arsenate reductase [Flaviramulus basaltis]|uniref:Arsenate reductase n=1 Tax=Flaviramulus basaltis TaxID=369401 RepID=A0A1K2IL05_9FLAO|nr:ArsC/Spx/MgsR family protein [Flaviramulus basaltis]SFZ92355.1 arsenate reductase [Flaviramulus basaltis]